MKKLLMLSFIFVMFIGGQGLHANAADLKNGSAFSFKFADPKGYFTNGAQITAHKNAFENAFSKMNNVSSKIKLIRNGSSPAIRTRSQNTKQEWYGLWDGGRYAGTISLNKYTTTRDKFTSANYNKTALHELGHALGLKHQSASSASLMKSGKYAYNDYTTLDKNNLKYQYGK
ncbi:matrixin family metalloprotease [Listeria booriae]|uniref:matrixin family metalloprotease n=1 Tax=Listeria booriae TaxID=1552123 RepID=UPI0016274E6E|nr:matrixin family metalloprotease [Listeria booriae]MBC2325053.1 matrixin family metalloprotease [Listeria booriae]MBC2328326.1 matrixin family metalloprotease [Listeria booriae]MCD2208771.1 matrixin family metalloprotease [Listeria booriae]